MILKIEGKADVDDPSPEDIAMGLATLDGGKVSFAILELDSQKYLQASGSGKEGFSLEYQDGSLKNHYECRSEQTLDAVVGAFQSYAKGGEDWRDSHDWTLMDLRPKARFHPGPVQFDRSPPALFTYALVCLAFVAVFFGKRGGNPRLWLVVFFSCVIFIAANFATVQLVKGSTRDRFNTYTRSGNPFAFWTAVITTYLFAALMVVALIVFLRKMG